MMCDCLLFIRECEISGALEKSYRQYLTGKLSKEQILDHIDSDIEIGMSYYKEFTANIPHKHPVATEYGYVLNGSVKILTLDGEKIEESFNEGDFFVIKRNCSYASKNSAGTKVLFIKAPGGNDKVCVDYGLDVVEWMKKW